MKLKPETIEAIERNLSPKTPLELKIEKDNVVVVKIDRRVISKENYR